MESSTLPILPSVAELSAMWHLWLFGFVLGLCAIYFRNMDRWSGYLRRLKGKADRKHEAHMRASR